MADNKMEKVVSLCKQRGFVFPGSEIYGGLANTWDYGPLGSQLKKNLKDAWWNTFIEKRQDMVGLDAAILMNPKTWEASGHVASFSDPLMDCKKCHARHRADKLVEEWQHNNESNEAPANWAGEKTPPKDLLGFIQEKNIPCPTCDACDWTEPRSFNLMFKTKQGIIEGEGSDVYLRPETAQGIFVNFKNILNATRKKLPFGVGQIGKAFRNEITPGNFIFRTREFEQMEIEYFIPQPPNWPEKRDEYMKKETTIDKWNKEDRDHVMQYFEKWKEDVMSFMTNTLGLKRDNLRFRAHSDDELAHYSKATIDIEYDFPFGWGELCAAGAYRTDYDINQHQSYSKEKLTYRDPYTQEEYIPHVIEPSFGSDRMLLATLVDAYDEEDLGDGKTRTVMRFKPSIAPIQAAVLPLKKNKEAIVQKGHHVANLLNDAGIRAVYDDTAAIGKLYRRQDEIGTPFCITIDFDSLDDDSVTIRHRDNMQQERVAISELTQLLEEKLYS